MNPVRNSQQADLPVLQNGLSDNVTSVSLASSLARVSRAGTRVRRNATGILSGLPNDHSFSYWKAPVFFPVREGMVVRQPAQDAGRIAANPEIGRAHV